MNKKDILEYIELNNITSVLTGDSALVMYGVIRKCDSVELCDDADFIIKDGIKLVGYDALLKYYEDNKKMYKKVKLFIDCQDNYKYERELREKGVTLIGGVDEVGRGPLVGPVVAACCILPRDFHLDGLTDSKKLSKAKRDYFFEEIKKQAISYGIGIVSEKRIDEINIYEATKEAMIMAINACDVRPEHVLTDAMKLDIDIPITPIIKGDLRSITISAASVLAKVTRDEMLEELDKKYPKYDFKNNVGYPTKKHLEAIEKFGIIPEHRRSYGPVRDYLINNIDKN